MIILTLLAILIVAAGIIVTGAVTVFVALFGDVIVAVLGIAAIVRLVRWMKESKKPVVESK